MRPIVWIGGQGGSTNNAFNGLIDEVRLWDVVRTAQQVFDSRAGLAPGDDEGLIGYWRMEDPSGGSVLLDASSFGNHGQLFGAAKTTLVDRLPKLNQPGPAQGASIAGTSGGAGGSAGQLGDPTVP